MYLKIIMYLKCFPFRFRFEIIAYFFLHADSILASSSTRSRYHKYDFPQFQIQETIRIKSRHNEKSRYILTCALGGGHVGTGLVPEQQPTLVGAGVDVALGTGAATVAPVVREGHGSVEGAGHGGCLLAEHRVQQGIAGYIRAERREAVAPVTVGCKFNGCVGCNVEEDYCAGGVFEVSKCFARMSDYDRRLLLIAYKCLFVDSEKFEIIGKSELKLLIISIFVIISYICYRME